MTNTEAPARLLSERDTCTYLGMSRSFLARARMDGPRNGQTPGPPYVKLGRSVRYDLLDLDQWLRENRHGGASGG